MKYIAFESTDKGIEIIAEIDCDKITGKDADAIRELLQSLGVPDKKQTCYCMLPALSELHSNLFLLAWQAT